MSLELRHASYAIKCTLIRRALTNTAKSVLNGKSGWFLKRAMEIKNPLCHQSISVISVQKHLVRHKCRKDNNSRIKSCPFCKKKYKNRQDCLDQHIKVCSKRNKWLNSMGFRMENIPLADRNTSSERFGYVCVKCGCRFKRLHIDRIAFHRCTNKIMKVKRNMNRYTNSYTKVVIDKTRISRRKFEGRICHNCKKIFPSRELCFNHYKRKLCKKVNLSVKIDCSTSSSTTTTNAIWCIL